MQCLDLLILNESIYLNQFTYVDNDTGVIFKVQEDTVSTAPGLALTNDNGGHNLLSQFRLTLLDGGNNDVTGSTAGQSVETTLDTTNSNDVKVLGSRVVSAVHDGTSYLERKKGAAKSTKFRLLQ
jgi:hypothetical protein